MTPRLLHGTYGPLDVWAIRRWNRANAKARRAYAADPFVNIIDTQVARAADRQEASSN